MHDYDSSSIVDRFTESVRKHFGYLSMERGFSVGESRLSDIDEPRDASVSIRFHSILVDVVVSMSLYGHGIGVLFRDAEWLNRPRESRVKSVALESVVAYRTNGREHAILEELTSRRLSHWPDGYLIANLDHAIERLADRVKQNALDIVAGDVTSFPAIENYRNRRHAT